MDNLSFYIEDKGNHDIYSIKCVEDNVELTANNEAGLFYGLVDLSNDKKDLNMLSVSLERGLNVDADVNIIQSNGFLKL